MECSEMIVPKYVSATVEEFVITLMDLAFVFLGGRVHFVTKRVKRVSLGRTVCKFVIA